MANDTQLLEERCAVRTGGNAAEQRALAAYLARTGLPTVVEFTPRDDEDLDTELRAGRFRRVIFSDLNALLTMAWKSQAHVSQWIEAGVRIDLAESPTGESDGSWLPVLEATCDSFSRWKRGQRVRKLIAAAVMSVLALAAAAVLLWLVPPAR